ncbi:MAG: hypothetical protein HEP70_13355 [Rhodobiaceae bacterium]|nr:hypothetical protein [Rhodobiaceae bacterium]
MASARPISADTLRYREAEFLIASASRLDGIKPDHAARAQLSDALTDNLHIWNLIVDKIMSEPDCQFSASLCLQTAALSATVLRYTHDAMTGPTATAVHVLANLNRELAAEFCAESTFVT